MINSLSAQDLSELDIKGIKVRQPYGRLLGEPEISAVMFIWGEKGAGKSTFSVGLADALAEHGRVEYIPAEENFGKTLIDKVKRLNATHSNLNFTKWKSVDVLKADLKKNNASFCVVDSISVIGANDKQTVDLAQWCREQGIGFIMVAHATKAGQYRGATSIAHECDIEIRVTQEGMAVAEKNRYAILTEIEVPFTADKKPEVNKPMKNRPAKAKPFSRKNPVEVPFTMMLSQIDKLHKIRSWRKVNSMLGSQMPCYTQKHSGESVASPVSIRYSPDYRNKKYVLDLLVEGRHEESICTEGANGGFQPCWKKLLDKHGSLAVIIYEQDHAKKVLGTKEYKRQEKLFKKKKIAECPEPEKPKKTKPKARKKPAEKTKKKPARKPKRAGKKKAKQTASGKRKSGAKEGGIDIEAAKKSQSQLDAFLDKVLN